jgi:hypothetical protein
MKKPLKILLVIAFVILFITGVWEAMYPDRDDPKNLHYVLWKWHLASIDLDRAVGVMSHDRSSEQMILGKNEKSLTSRFGYLLSPEVASPCYGPAAREATANGDKVLFLRKSDYMIVFHNGVATRVVLLDTAWPC